MADLLVVEDEYALGEFVRQALAREQVPFRLAQNGRQALDLAEERWPAAVLLDLTLPGALDGWQVWDALLDQAHGRRLRVIVFAADLDSQDQDQARQRGVWVVLRKPVARDRLVEDVRRALGEAVADV